MEQKNNKNEETQTAPKKMSLAEAAKRKLAEKKEANKQKQQGYHAQANQEMKSQQTKKVSNTRRKMGS